MRLTDADDYRRAYLTMHVDSAIPSVSLSISGATSTCCGARTLTGRTGKRLCYECRQPCGEKMWNAPRSAAHRGGGNCIRVRERRQIDKERGHRLMFQWWRAFKPYHALFRLPGNMEATDWERRLLAWDGVIGWLLPRTFDSVARLGQKFAPKDERDLWTSVNVTLWVREARSITIERVVRRASVDERACA